MRVSCIHCGGPHPGFECRNKKSTAARKDVPESSRVGSAFEAAPTTKRTTPPRRSNGPGEAGTQALPVDTNSSTAARTVEGTTEAIRDENGQSGGKPLPKFDKKAWQREYMRSYMRKRRAALKGNEHG